MKMRKGFLVGGLLLAITLPASALNVKGYDGPYNINLNNWDTGSAYAVGNDAATEAECDAEAIATPNNALPGEDGWGIFRVTQITARPGGSLPSGTSIWAPSASTELWGVFHGIVDETVTWTGFSVVITGRNFVLDIYEVPTGLLGAPESSGSAGRIPPNGFTGISDLPGAVHILSGVSRAGGPIAGVDEYRAELDYTNAGVFFNGEYDTYVDLLPGTRDYDQFNTDGELGGTDMWIQGDLEPYVGGADWDYFSSDPVRGRVVIPEPLTMSAFGMAAFGIAGYIRKRNRR
jgi:hypothetical protein